MAKMAGGYASKATSLELLPPHVDGRGLEVLGPSSPAFPGPLAGSGAARTQISTSQAAASPPESQCCLLTLITTKNFNLSCRRVLKMLQHNKKKMTKKNYTWILRAYRKYIHHQLWAQFSKVVWDFYHLFGFGLKGWVSKRGRKISSTHWSLPKRPQVRAGSG